MKRGFLRTIPALLLPIMLLSSCRHSTLRTNAIEAGVFAGPDTTGEYECTLTIEEISDVEYIKANEVNVLKDLVGGGYYKVAFSAVGKADTIKYDFVSFQDAYNGSPEIYAAYMDANNSWIIPREPSSKKEGEKHMKYGLYITYDSKADALSAILEWVDPSSNA
ncbi:MAG: hypothetical protein K6B51_03890 [Bacilli bacterium]|nr:hypothetical protein [Bacilli bacterium]